MEKKEIQNLYLLVLLDCFIAPVYGVSIERMVL